MPKMSLVCDWCGKEYTSYQYRPENLEVMTQSEHIHEHLRRGGGRLAQTV